MVVKVDEILEKGLTVSEPLRLPLLEEATEGTDFKPVRKGTLSAHFLKVSGGVLLKADGEIEVSALCKRCLAEVKQTLPLAFTLNFIRPEKATAAGHESEGDDDGQGEEAGTFGLGDADQEVFDGKQIDLDPVVKEQVLLALPMDSVCKETCKGLCGQCGQNLNEAPCGCQPKALDPRLSALKNIKLGPHQA